MVYNKFYSMYFIFVSSNPIGYALMVINLNVFLLHRLCLSELEEKSSAALLCSQVTSTIWIPAVHNYDGCAEVCVEVEAVNLCVCVCVWVLLDEPFWGQTDKRRDCVGDLWS